MITVHGLLGQPSLELRMSAASADWVVGGRRHLDTLGVPEERRIVLGALRPAIEKVAAIPSEAFVVVVASGDPLYFGVVRALRDEGLHPEVVTAPSSIAAAFAAVGLPWDDAVVVSVHGRPLAAAVNLARSLGKVAVFTSAENGIRELAAQLSDVARWYVLAERLGETDECVRILDAAAAAVTQPLEPNVVLVLAAPPEQLDGQWSGAVAGPARGRRPEVSAPAAVAFARILPEPGELVWVSGVLGADVAALCCWAQAAVLDPTTGAAACPTNPDVVVADFCQLPALDFEPGPRAIVLAGPTPDKLPPGYRWRTETIGDTALTTGVLP